MLADGLLFLEICWRMFGGLGECKEAEMDADEEMTSVSSACFYILHRWPPTVQAGYKSNGMYSISLNDASQALRSHWSGISPQIYSEAEFKTRLVENTLIRS